MKLSLSRLSVRINILIVLITFLKIYQPGTLIVAQETIDVGETGWNEKGNLKMLISLLRLPFYCNALLLSGWFILIIVNKSGLTPF